MKEKNHQPRIIYPEELSFRYEAEIKVFLGKQKLTEFTTTQFALQEMLKGALLSESKRQNDTKLKDDRQKQKIATPVQNSVLNTSIA